MAGSPRQLVFDAHVDSLQCQLDLEEDLGALTSGHLDLPRGERGGLGAAVFVSWVDPKHLAEPGGVRARTQALLHEFHVLLERHPGKIRFTGNGRDLAAARAAGAMAGIAGIEGGHSIEESLDRLRELFGQGLRVLTLVWNNHLSWIRSCRDGAGSSIPEGLSSFGREVVREMNALGMLVDLSHAGERSFYDAIEASTQPVIASHSACRTLHDHPRNLTDDQLRVLARNGGVVGIPFCVAFLSREAQEEDARLRESSEYRALSARNDTELFRDQGRYLQRHAAPLSIDRVVDHVLHAAEIAGIDHVGLGSDYDGIGRTPAGLEDASCYANLSARLRARGLASEDVEKVLWRNMRGVFEKVTGPGTEADRSSRLEPVRVGAGKTGFRV
ncbi:MAG: dipeptidase [Planctomycetota bacterium]